jgi:hypothetical protein
MPDAPRRPKIDTVFQTEEEIRELVAQFESCCWPYERWTHRAHLAVAVWYLSHYPLDEATERMRRGLQSYNRLVGDPAGYHETVTVFYMQAIHRVLERPEEASVPAIVEELHRRFHLAWLMEHYSPAVLWSAQARDHWVEPDLKRPRE